jgi:hypothetical protein
MAENTGDLVQGALLVNQAFVKRFFEHEDPLGQRFGLNGPEYADAFQIVGVFADFILSDPGKEAQPLFLRPLGQVYTGYSNPNLQASEQSSLFLNRIILQFNRSQTQRRTAGLLGYCSCQSEHTGY